MDDKPFKKDRTSAHNRQSAGFFFREYDSLLRIDSNTILLFARRHGEKNANEKEAHMDQSVEQSVEQAVASQKELFKSGTTLDLLFRGKQLKRLYDEILLQQKNIEQALYADLGKSADESWMSEIGLVLEAIRYQIRHLCSASRVHLHTVPLHQMPALYETVRIPYGTVLIMAPWNYPFYLAMVPLAEAIAAGNTVVLKTGHAATETSRVIAEIVQNIYDPDYVTVFTQGREEIEALLEEDFDYIFFTGGKKLGSMVMEAASKHLTPLTLELGGKSPAVVDESANLALAARRIVFGKFLNAGQTCVAPDYVLVHDSVLEPFMAALMHEIRRQYPSPERIGKIISPAHYERLIGYIHPKQVAIGGRASGTTLQIEPTVLLDVDWDDPVMQEEIFGPILPVLTFTNFRQMMQELADKPTPLAFYLFTRNRLQKQYMKYVQPFGGGCINDTIIQLASDSVPFGGMGASGMGQYHGKWGYETFSHIKSVAVKPDVKILDLPLRYNDRKPWMASLIRKVLR